MFDTVLIANRGEIALRIARTCRELGIRTVAVYSAADERSAVVEYADEAVRIGPAASRKSYLNIAAIVEAARRTGARAVHPGYGFLSEDPDLAEVCRNNGIVFVGPPPEVLANLGDKIEARRLMADAGVPVLPGSASAVGSVAEAEAVAAEVGLPVMIKAAAGGGGRGMHVVHHHADVSGAFRLIRARARELFGDQRVFVEKFVERARHIEVQVLADVNGDVVHLGQRDCSAQRRHQKLIEESPAPRLPRETAARMAAAAVSGAAASGYVGAGTFEFLLGPDGSFWFLEVNCRIQVEHPVTEMVFGVDLVREQLHIAAGRPLGMRQDEIAGQGWAVEARVYAEDPERGFAPAPGTLHEFSVPAGPFVRVDTHASAGYRIPPFYDPLLAKLVAWGRTREEAVSRLDRALVDFHASGDGVRTTSQFLREVIRDHRFQAGCYDTAIIDGVLAGRSPSPTGPDSSPPAAGMRRADRRAV